MVTLRQVVGISGQMVPTEFSILIIKRLISSIILTISLSSYIFPLFRPARCVSPASRRFRCFWPALRPSPPRDRPSLTALVVPVLTIFWLRSKTMATSACLVISSRSLLILCRLRLLLLLSVTTLLPRPLWVLVHRDQDRAQVPWALALVDWVPMQAQE